MAAICLKSVCNARKSVAGGSFGWGELGEEEGLTMRVEEGSRRGPEGSEEGVGSDAGGRIAAGAGTGVLREPGQRDLVEAGVGGGIEGLS
jgi:hypothetical protein